MDYSLKTALLVVDIQNDFAHSKGSLYVEGGAEIIPALNQEAARAKAAGALVIYTQDWHPPHTPHFQADGGVWPVHCVRDTWGAKFHSKLDILGETMRKGSSGEDGYSGFSVRDPRSGSQSATALEQKLRERAIEHVVIAGIATDYCVKETALDALRLGFEATVLGDLIRAVNLNPSDGDQALQAIRSAGGKIQNSAPVP